MTDELTIAVVPISATIYSWQREALERYQKTIGVFSLSEALRAVLSQALPRPEQLSELQEQTL
jgi:hypothetical protein